MAPPAPGVSVKLEDPPVSPPGVVETDEVLALLVEAPAGPVDGADCPPAESGLDVGVLVALEPPLHAARVKTETRINDKINPDFFIL